MSLRLICGRAGTGKSSFCFEEIKERLQYSSQKIYMITPEQFSFTAEQKLMQTVEKLNRKAVIGCEVLTFDRMAYRVAGEVGGVTKTDLLASRKVYAYLSFTSK